MKKQLLIISLMLLSLTQVFAQVSVKGKVTSADGEPLLGVTIVIKGTGKGVITDLDGNYIITELKQDDILVFSSVGMLTKEVKVGTQTTIDIVLEQDVQNLDEVVVVGYGEVKRANLTGAVSSMRADEIMNVPVSNLATALKGRMAGVKIGLATGKPGANTTLKIRTEASFGTAEQVLYVIDGVIFDGGEQFNMLDATEVESISILKDAEAAIYGARGSGGVVIVKTKRGQKGKPKISYNGSYGISKVSNIPEMLNGPELANLVNYALDSQNSEGGRLKTDYYTPEEVEYFEKVNYNWMDNLIKDATTARHTVNISGGTDKLRYFTGATYFDEDGAMENLWVKKYSLRSNLEADITSNLMASVSFSINNKSTKEPYYDGETQVGVLRDTYKQALIAPPWVPAEINGMPVGNQVSWNPFGLINSGSYKSGNGSSIQLQGNFNYAVPIIKGLKLGLMYSYMQDNSRGKKYAQDYSLYNFPTEGNIILDTTAGYKEKPIGNGEGIQESSNHGSSYQLNGTISYNRTLGQHDISALVVYEQTESQTEGYWTRLKGAAIKGYEYIWAFNQTKMEDGSSAGESGRLGYIGRLNYKFARKYILESHFRYEASQKFHPDNRWGLFPAVSAGWLVSEEGFFSNNVPFINYLKLRGSWGIVGNDNVSSFLWRHSFGADETGAIFGSAVSNAIATKNYGVISRDITWQKIRNINIGLDVKVLDEKLEIGIDAYHKLGYDILTPATSTIPTTMGIEKMPAQNYGEMWAKGIEVELRNQGKLFNGVMYYVQGNFSWDKHRKLKVYQNPAVIGTWKDELLNDPSNQPGYICNGIIRTQDDLDAILEKYPEYTINGNEPELGMLWYEDVRGEFYVDDDGHGQYREPDGKITEADQTIIAEYTSAPYNYGFSFGASWKGFKVDLSFSGEFGHKAFVQKDEQTLPVVTTTGVTNVFSFWGDYYCNPDALGYTSPFSQHTANIDAAYPRPFNYGLEGQHSTFWMRDGNTLTMDNLNVSYALPEKYAQYLRLDQVRLYFTARNVWTIISPFDYKDPSVSRAYDYPMMRTYNFGINVSL